jgi:hypothetical protein
MSEKSPSTPSATPPDPSSPSGAPVDAIAGPGTNDVGNPRDIQGILALTFAVGWHVVLGLSVIYGGVAMLQVAVPAEAGLIGSIIGYYFGVKSQQ